MLYQIIKGLHNILRWVVVLGGLYAIVTSLQGLLNKGAWTDTNKRAGLIFTSALNTQFILGIILYVVSPYINGLIKAGMGNVMSDQQSRFFLIEHAFSMILALVAAQLGYSLARRAKTDRAKFVRSSIGYVLAALLIAYAIPWSRPLFPGL
jgi:hypothetical protein